ncbi:MAG: hypothetical protein HGJ94_00235 [Desulfosarcina sp.]|nr:hypothetical protein [Desulfosarcina sp.]MBC2744111.1 hypothetical protein [Desulfosarcina sp.]MBC2767020.1 hypothetical protein [Desulfosarcina sp.]
MITKAKKRGPVCGRIVGERRTSINRRVLTYDWYIPERRAVADRRQGRSGARSNHGK